MATKDTTWSGFFFALATAIPTYALHGFVLAKMWAWFIAVPFGLPQFGIAQAVGASAMIGLTTKQFGLPTVDRTAIEKVTMSVVVSLLTLLVGWVAKQFM